MTCQKNDKPSRRPEVTLGKSSQVGSFAFGFIFIGDGACLVCPICNNEVETGKSCCGWNQGGFKLSDLSKGESND